MDVTDLWGNMVPTYNDDVMVCNHCYEYVLACGLGLDIGAENERVLMQKRTTAALEQLRLPQVFCRAALHAPLG